MTMSPTGDLISKHQNTITAIVEILKAMGVISIYIKEPTNISPFFDLDMYLVAKQETISEIYEQRRTVFSKIGPILTVWGNKFSESNISINVVFDFETDPLKIDINTKLQEKLKPSYKFKTINILYDPLNIIKKIQEDSINLEPNYGQIDPKDLQLKIDQFYGWGFNTLSKIYKQDYESVIFEHYTDYLERIILPIYFTLEDKPCEGFYNAQTRINRELLENIRQLDLGFNKEQQIRGLLKIVEIFKTLANKACEKYLLIYPEKAEKVFKEQLAKYFS
jgi:hypothetical protein